MSQEMTVIKTTSTEPIAQNVTTTTTTTTTTTEMVPIDRGNRPIGALLLIPILFAALALFVIGTSIPWFSYLLPGSAQYVTLWEEKSIQNGVTTATRTPTGDTCDARKNRFQSAESFAIISIFFALVALVIAIVAFITKKAALRIVAAFIALIAFITSVVCWSTMINLYYVGICGITSYNARFFDIDAGGGIFITASALCFIAVVVALLNPSIPVIITQDYLNRAAGLLLFICGFVGLIFIIVGQAIPFAELLTATQANTIAVWRVTNNGVSRLWDDVNCGTMFKTAHVGESFAVITIITTLVAAIVGLFGLYGKVGKKVMLPVAALATATAIITVAAEARLYYFTFCSVSLFGQGYRLTAGAVLIVTTLALAAFATIVILAIALYELFVTKKAGETVGNASWSALLFLVGVFAAELLLGLGVSFDAFSRNLGESTIGTRVTFTETLTPAGAVPFGCTTVFQYLNGALALVVISIFFLIIAFALGIAQLINATLRIPASVFGFVASVTNLTAWALTVALYYRTICDQASPKNQGFNLGTGLQLIIAAWCITLVVSIINLVIRPVE